jgi:pyridoxamine 5'-phosphate oxidase
VAGSAPEQTEGEEPHRGLDESNADPDPLQQFRRWFADAQASGHPQPDAMALATATLDGVPSVRMVLYKGLDEGGFAFYTNVESPKGRELAANPRAALAFYWVELHRQVRAAGTVSRLLDEESSRYFATRPREAQLSAWASSQSEVIGSRAALVARFAEAEARFEGRDVPLPPFWGGYRLRPESVEFWQGHPHRLHDRLRYSREPDGGWRIARLQP